MKTNLEDAAWDAMLSLWARLIAEGHILPEQSQLLLTHEGERAWRQGDQNAQAALQQAARSSD